MRLKNIFIFIILLTPTGAHAQEFPFSTEGLGNTPHSQLDTILEKTFLNVDVLRLKILLPAQTAEKISAVIQANSDQQNFDEIANIAGHSEAAVASIEFLRSVLLSQFLQGIQDNLILAKKAGYISQTDYQMISNGLPKWYAFLKERGIHKGDWMFYKMAKNTLRVIYKADDGKILLDQTDTGPERRLSVLGSYFAPGSDFREGLMQSLIK